MPLGRYVVPVELLSKYRDETVEILRLGALANALNSVAAMATTSLSTGVGHDRDVLQTGLLVASYLKEAIDILDQRRLWVLVEKAVAAGYKLPHEVDYYRQLFSRTKGSLYKRVLVGQRSKKGFHVDRDHFEQWMRSVQAPEITVWQRDSEFVLDWAFTASMQIQSFYGPQMEGGYDTARDLGNAPHLVFVVEAACAGLVVEAGYDFRSAWRPTLFISARIEYQFRDGRPTTTRHRVVSVEEGGQLTGTAMHLLERHFSEVFGVLSNRQHVGWVLNPADGGLMMFNSPHGSARVFRESPATQPRIEIPDDIGLFIRLRDAGSWGEQQTVAALTFAESVRDGRGTRETIDTFAKQFSESVEYWRGIRSFAEEAVKRRRQQQKE